MAKETTEMIEKQNLFQEFEAVSTDDWKRAIEKFLKGKAIESLDWEIEEGLVVSPIQRLGDSEHQYLGSTHQQSNNQWHICESIQVGGSKGYSAANQQILHALDKGANALILDFLKIPTLAELTTLLDGVLLELVHLHFKGFAIGAFPAPFLVSLAQLSDAHKIQGSCDFGNLSVEDFMRAHLVCLDKLPQMRLINIPIEHSSTQNLSDAIYMASNWIDKLLKKGLKIEQILNYLRFEFNVGTHYFAELSYLRAFKKLWFGLLEAYGLEQAISPFIHANTRSDQNEDQYWNMIVATTQAMSAAIAGVNSICVLPCNGLERADEFTQRIARNVQHILQSESYLDRVLDPAAGSYYIENMTAAIAKKSWQQFCAL